MEYVCSSYTRFEDIHAELAFREVYDNQNYLSFTNKW